MLNNKWVKEKLKKFFSTLFSRENSGKFVQPILYAAQGNAYVETISDKADSLHRDLKCYYEDDLQSSYLSLLNTLAPYFRKNKVRLAIDKHEIGYYGKEEGLFIVGTSYGNKSYSKAFEYITISLLTGKKEERLHLYAIPWHIGQDLTESVEILLNVVKKWFNKIEVVEFDRGFHSNELIHWLEEKKTPYLIHIKMQGKFLEELVKNTKSFYRGKYRKKFYANMTGYWMETNLYVCKNVREKDWLFVSSIGFRNKLQLVNLYRNRWQIETNYAINNQNRIMSKSTNYCIRYFYFLCDMLLQILWRLSSLVNISFKTFLLSFVIGIQQLQIIKPNLKIG